MNGHDENGGKLTNMPGKGSVTAPLRKDLCVNVTVERAELEVGFAILLDQIPELDVRTLDKGCSGMAGTFGLTRENFDLSLEIGQPLIDEMRSPDFILGATECSSCRLQMQQDSPLETVHPIKLLAAS